MDRFARFLEGRARSFEHAFRGFGVVLRTQPNAWIHAAATLVVLAMGIALHIPVQGWAELVLAIALVWTAEFINTALENVVDLASPQQHPLARAGKDVAAAAVLIAALASVVIGLLVLGPPLWQVLTGWLSH